MIIAWAFVIVTWNDLNLFQVGPFQSLSDCNDSRQLIRDEFGHFGLVKRLHSTSCFKVVIR